MFELEVVTVQADTASGHPVRQLRVAKTMLEAEELARDIVSANTHIAVTHVVRDSVRLGMRSLAFVSPVGIVGFANIAEVPDGA